MNTNEYQLKAMQKEADQSALTKFIEAENHRLSDLATRFSNGVIGLTDECGELSALRKRWLEYRGEPPTAVEVLEECGDVLWRTTQILSAFGLTLEQAMEANIEKLHEVRYKDVICNPHDAKEENRDRVAEATAVRRLTSNDCDLPQCPSKQRAEDDGVDYGTGE